MPQSTSQPSGPYHTRAPVPTSPLPSSGGSAPRSGPPLIALSIAGYDPSAGAGVLADLKTFSALGVYGMAAVTAFTIQSTQGVRRVIPIDPDTVTETLDCLAEDVRFHAIKVGMLAEGIVATAVFHWLDKQKEVPVVLDPVLKSSSGKDLLDPKGSEVLRRSGVRRANWITPNLAELAALTGQSVPSNSEQTENLARDLSRLAKSVGNSSLNIVVTGGHASEPNDLLLVEGTCHWFRGEWVRTNATHGTGCTFSSALAARIAFGDEPEEAVAHAKSYVTRALQHAKSIGKGNGPLGHFW